MRSILGLPMLAGIFGIIISPALGADELKDPAALADLVRIIESNGYFCPRVIGAWAMGIDGAYGPTFNVVCPGDTAMGTRYKVSMPSRGVFRVRVGW